MTLPAHVIVQPHRVGVEIFMLPAHYTEFSVSQFHGSVACVFHVESENVVVVPASMQVFEIFDAVVGSGCEHVVVFHIPSL